MGEILLQQTALILVILLIRKIAGRKMNVYVRYGLWILVLFRLLIPVNFESKVSLSGIFPALEEYGREYTGVPCLL